MYVCVCNAVTERDIGHAVSRGCDSLRGLREELGVGTCCGRCNSCARRVLHQSLEKSECAGHRDGHTHAHRPPAPAPAFALATA
jgi:bacterioferritin-associated ferredoxin